MNKSASRLTVVLIAAAVGVGAYYWWQHRSVPPLPVAEVTAPAPVTSVVEPPAPAASLPVEPGIEYPIETIETASATPGAALPALVDADPYLRDALVGLLGRKDVLRFLQLDGFVRRVVATVDNLARSHAPWSMWPVNPTSGRFTVLAQGDKQVISADNGLRYSALVVFIESINTTQAVQLYARLYPLFQQAYEELGYPGRYFNDRLVAVIDHLLTTPVQAGPIEVYLVDVKGTVPSLRPWVRYEFADPALQSLSAGQKMLIRSGPVNHRRLNAKLLEIRRQVAGAALARP